MAKRYYDVCPYCNGNLDPGEICTCRQEKEQETNRIMSMYRAGKRGQMQICFTEVHEREKEVV